MPLSSSRLCFCIACMCYFVVFFAHEDDNTQHVFENNCASMKLCNKAFKDRHSSVHAIPPEWEQYKDQIPNSHWKPVGHSEFEGTWAGPISVLDDIDTPTFWSRYVSNKPFVLSGFAKSSPAFERWTNSYLVDRIGDLKMKVNAKNEDRLKPHCNRFRGWTKILCRSDVAGFPDIYMNASLFMAESSSTLSDYKISTQMPDILRDDVIAPLFHSCIQRDSADLAAAPHRKGLMEFSEFDLTLSFDKEDEFSSNVIHYEVSHQVVCLFDGKQEWIAWDMARDHNRVQMWGSYYDGSLKTSSSADDSPIDAERVDLFVFPGMKEARWMNATLHAGDCLFMPAFFAHYTRSWGRTVAVAQHWSNKIQYDPTCGQAPEKPQPLSAHEVLWTYPEDRSLVDWDMVKMRFPNWKNRIRELAMRARRREEKLTKKEFSSYLKEVAKEAGGMHNIKSRVASIFRAMDTQETGTVDCLQIFQSKDLQLLLKEIAVIQAGKPQQQLEDSQTLHRLAITSSQTLKHREL